MKTSFTTTAVCLAICSMALVATADAIPRGRVLKKTNNKTNKSGGKNRKYGKSGATLGS